MTHVGDDADDRAQARRTLYAHLDALAERALVGPVASHERVVDDGHASGGAVVGGDEVAALSKRDAKRREVATRHGGGLYRLRLIGRGDGPSLDLEPRFVLTDPWREGERRRHSR